MQEVWKDIKGYEGYYQISNLGRVKSLPRKYKNRIVKDEIIKVPSKLPKGYLRVGLYKEGTTKYFYIHRLVAETFLNKIKGKDFVNHKDCNPTNNKVNNLEWCTLIENNLYKNRKLKIHISSVIYYLEKDYPDKNNLIESAKKLKDEIKLL